MSLLAGQTRRGRGHVRGHCGGTLPTRFLTGAAAAAGVALINTIGNLAGFSAPYITGAVHDWTGGYEVPMVIVGLVMLVSAVLMILLARSNRIAPAPSVAAGSHGEDVDG